MAEKCGQAQTSRAAPFSNSPCRKWKKNERLEQNHGPLASKAALKCSLPSTGDRPPRGSQAAARRLRRALPSSRSTCGMRSSMRSTAIPRSGTDSLRELLPMTRSPRLLPPWPPANADRSAQMEFIAARRRATSDMHLGTPTAVTSSEHRLAAEHPVSMAEVGDDDGKDDEHARADKTQGRGI